MKVCRSDWKIESPAQYVEMINVGRALKAEFAA